MAYTKYSLTPANNTATPPDGAPEGMLPSAVNDTMRDMMAQIRDCGDGIRDGTYTMTAAKITGGTITGVTLTGNTFSNPTITGVSTFAAGTVSAPAITTSGDTNTGIYFPAADTIAFTEGGAEAMRIDSSGNVGIGTSSPSTQLQMNSSAATYSDQLRIRNTNFGNADIGVGSGIMAIATDMANITFYTSSNLGTTGSATPSNERMRIDSSGNVGIGTSSPNGKVDIVSSSAGANTNTLFLTNSSGTANTATSLVFGVGSDPTNRQAVIRGINAGGNAINLAFLTSNADAPAERMRIDSSGNVGIGTSTITSGAGWTPTLVLSATSAALVVKGINSQENSFGTSNGLYIDCLGNSTGTNNNIIFRNTSANSNFTAVERMRITSGGVLELAQGQIKFPATQSASSDANTLDDYEEGTWTPTNSIVALTSNSGTYTKIGRVVQWSCTFIVPSTANTTAIKIDGLPFTCANDQAARAGSSVGYTNSGTIMTVMVDTNSTSFYFYTYAGANIILNNLSNSYVYCGGTYTV